MSQLESYPDKPLNYRAAAKFSSREKGRGVVNVSQNASFHQSFGHLLQVDIKIAAQHLFRCDARMYAMTLGALFFCSGLAFFAL